jgi:Cof subfamily protein (haloacid dehalogenase superfamily)
MVATDLDGTLLRGDGSVGRRTVAALAACAVAGIPVVPITARPPHATWPLLQAASPAGIDGLVVCANGAMVCDGRTHAVLQVDLLAASIAGRLVEQVRAAVPGILLAVDAPDRFVHEPGFFRGDDGWDDEVLEVPDVLDVVGDGVVKVVARRDGRSAADLVAAIEGILGEEANATSSNPEWVELSAFGVTKAHGLLSVCDLLGVPLSEVAAVGDNMNDLSMLAAAGLACAVANARPEVLAVADRVLATNDDEGVAELLEEVAAASAQPEIPTTGPSSRRPARSPKEEPP